MRGRGSLCSPMRVVIVDNHEMVRTGLKAMLAGNPDVRVVGEAPDASTGAQITTDLDPDVVLTEIRLGNTSGLDLCRDVLSRCATARVVILTVHDDEHYLHRALRAGVRGYLLKLISGDELTAALQRVYAGETVIDPALAGQVASPRTGVRAGEYWSGGRLGLTQRESEILALVVGGMANSAIAGRLFVGEETVRTHVRSIYRKLDVTDRAAAVATALREGLFQ